MHESLLIVPVDEWLVVEPVHEWLVIVQQHVALFPAVPLLVVYMGLLSLFVVWYCRYHLDNIRC